MIDDITGRVETDISTNSSLNRQCITSVHNNRVDDHVSCTDEGTKIDFVNEYSSKSVLHNSSSDHFEKEVGDYGVSDSPPIAHNDHLVEGCKDAGIDTNSLLPPLPETTFEFQNHWKQLRGNRLHLVAYFKVGQAPLACTYTICKIYCHNV